MPWINSSQVFQEMKRICPSNMSKPMRKAILLSLQSNHKKSKGNRHQPVKQHICTIVNADSLNKIRAIAKTEGLTINSIIDLGLDIVIKKYEELHGTIQVKKPKKGDVGKVFNL